MILTAFSNLTLLSLFTNTANLFLSRHWFRLTHRYSLLAGSFELAYQVLVQLPPSQTCRNQRRLSIMSTFPPYYGPQANASNAIALPFFALVGLLITYLPLRSFWSHRNVPLISIVIGNGIYNLWSFLNPIIWPNDNQALWWPGYGLCDIQALLSYPVGIALAASLCALSRRLAGALDTENASIHQTKASRRRKTITDVVFCWGIPVLQLALHYVIQSGRYQIYPVYGCADVLDNSWPTIVIIMIWLPFFTFLNMYYAGKFLYSCYAAFTNSRQYSCSSASASTVIRSALP